jgi:hypothetical protein
MVKSSIIQTGVLVSTINSGGGIGLGYLYNGKIWVSCGNGYYKCENLMYAIIKHYIDNGAFYRKQF